ncbi:dachshund 1-like isoform X1, partial [Clarias magur]
MAVPAALIPPSSLVQPSPISSSSSSSSSSVNTSSPSATSSPCPSVAPAAANPFRSELRAAAGSPAIPIAVTPTPLAAKPVYSTPSPVENTPQNNECKMVELRGAQVASFTVDGRELICLPQAFDLFLKHLVGGLHTVYTKLKRLEITPVVCNVEQVRVLRGLGAIQPGVNRCKLISRKDFETLYNDCTNASSRPGRPPKRTQSVTSPENPHIMPHSVPGLMSPGMIPPT